MKKVIAKFMACVLAAAFVAVAVPNAAPVDPSEPIAIAPACILPEVDTGN